MALFRDHKTNNINIKGLKIPNGRRQTSWLFKGCLGNSTRDYREQIQLVVRVGLDLRAYKL